MKGFLFTPEMAVAAMREDCPKTVTRRVMSPQPSETHETADRTSYRMEPVLGEDSETGRTYANFAYTMGETESIPCDYKPSERRCLLTTWAVHMKFDKLKPTELPGDLVSWGGIWHAGMGTPHPTKFGKLRPGRFLPNHLRALMPVLEVVSVRAERVQAITDADAEAEGIGKSWPNYAYNLRSHRAHDFTVFDSARASFASLWDSINAKRGFGWKENPWCWRVEFRRVTP